MSRWLAAPSTENPILCLGRTGIDGSTRILHNGSIERSIVTPERGIAATSRPVAALTRVNDNVTADEEGNVASSEPKTSDHAKIMILKSLKGKSTPTDAHALGRDRTGIA